MDERPGTSRWTDEPPAVHGEPCNLDDLVPPEQRRPWIIWLMGHLDRLVLVLFLTVFAYMMVRYLWGR